MVVIVIFYLKTFGSAFELCVSELDSISGSVLRVGPWLTRLLSRIRSERRFSPILRSTWILFNLGTL